MIRTLEVKQVSDIDYHVTVILHKDSLDFPDFIVVIIEDSAGSFRFRINKGVPLLLDAGVSWCNDEGLSCTIRADSSGIFRVYTENKQENVSLEYSLPAFVYPAILEWYHLL